MTSTEKIERITPTQLNLNEFFEQYPDHKQRYEFAISRINDDMKILDIACGVGYGSWLMAQKAYKVVGVDISNDAIEHANKHFRTENNLFLHGHQFTSKSEFDMVISFETIEHMDEDSGDIFLCQLHASLKPNGIMIISTPINKTDKKENVNQFHIREYDDNEFPQKLQKNGFDIIEMYGQGSDFHEKLYGSNQRISLFNLMKLGIHKIFPRPVRDYLKRIFMGDPSHGLQIKKENWRNSMVQIAVCKRAD